MTTPTAPSTRSPRRRLRATATVVAGLTIAALATAPADLVDAQESYQRISGEGSSWAANAIDAMRVNVAQFGITVDYAPTGSTSGRKNYLNGTVDFAASDIPFQFEPEDGSAPENPEADSYAYIPVTAGGTAFMYNLKINGQQVTNLRLSGENVTRIFTGDATMWNDASIQADNPGITLPARPIVPVVRSDGSGSTAQFTLWMIDRHPELWNAFCDRAGRAQCGSTSFYPTLSSFVGQQGDLGVAGYVSQSFAEGAIGYVNYSYALGISFPVAKVLNAAGFYTEPTPENVAVSLLKAKINNDASDPAVYLTQDLSEVYTDQDPRNYQLSSYSYFILPTKVQGQFNEAKGRTLGTFAYYAMCQAQQSSASLGYSPIPINLVTASFEQIRKIPGVEAQDVNVQDCDNPTFSPDGTNLLAQNAPMPQECDRQSQFQCPDGTGGMWNIPTAVSAELPPDPPDNSGGSGGDSGGQSGAGDQSGGSGGQTGGQEQSGGQTGGQSQSGGSGGQTGGQAQSGGSGTDDATSTGGDTSAGNGNAAADINVVDSGVSGSQVTSSGDQTTGGAQQTADGATAESGQVANNDVVAQASPTAGNPAVGQQTVLPVSPVIATTVDSSSDWGSRAPLILLVTVLLLGLLFGPALAWQRISQREATA